MTRQIVKPPVSGVSSMAGKWSIHDPQNHTPKKTTRNLKKGVVLVRWFYYSFFDPCFHEIPIQKTSSLVGPVGCFNPLHFVFSPSKIVSKGKNNQNIPLSFCFVILCPPGLSGRCGHLPGPRLHARLPCQMHRFVRGQTKGANKGRELGAKPPKTAGKAMQGD